MEFSGVHPPTICLWIILQGSSNIQYNEEMSLVALLNKSLFQKGRLFLLQLSNSNGKRKQR